MHRVAHLQQRQRSSVAFDERGGESSALDAPLRRRAPTARRIPGGDNPIIAGVNQPLRVSFVANTRD
jgi:hypothetical protein